MLLNNRKSSSGLTFFIIILLCFSTWQNAQCVSPEQKTTNNPFLNDKAAVVEWKRKFEEQVKDPQSEFSRIVKEAKGNDLLELEVASLKFIMDNHKNDEECVKQTIKFLRKCYESSTYSYTELISVGSGNVLEPATLPTYLYIYTGRNEGLLEYTKLSGMFARPLMMLWENNRKWNDENILNYLIYSLNKNTELSYNAETFGGTLKFSPYFIFVLKSLTHNFGIENPKVKRAVISIVSSENSPIRSLAKMKDRGVPNIDSAEKYIDIIYRDFVKGSTWETEFLTIAGNWDGQAFADRKDLVKFKKVNADFVGQTAPAIDTYSAIGQHLSLPKSISSKNTLITFFPKCFTGGCQNHLSSLRDVYSQLQAQGIEIWAVSVDPADGDQGQKAFAEQWKLPFPLIPDVDRKISIAYGAAATPRDLASRQTVFIDKEGKVAFVDREVNVTTHGADVLAKAKELGWIK